MWYPVELYKENAFKHVTKVLDFIHLIIFHLLALYCINFCLHIVLNKVDYRYSQAIESAKKLSEI